MSKIQQALNIIKARKTISAATGSSRIAQAVQRDSVTVPEIAVSKPVAEVVPKTRAGNIVSGYLIQLPSLEHAPIVECLFELGNCSVSRADHSVEYLLMGSWNGIATQPIAWGVGHRAVVRSIDDS